MDNLTIPEYNLLMKANALQQLDRDRDIHLQAYMNQLAKATEKKGKRQVPVYPTFKDFYDHEKKEQELLNPVEIIKNKNNRVHLITQANRG